MPNIRSLIYCRQVDENPKGAALWTQQGVFGERDIPHERPQAQSTYRVRAIKRTQ